MSTRRTVLDHLTRQRAPRSQRPLAAVALLSCLLAASPASVAAQPVAAAQEPGPAGDEMIVALRINGIDRGEAIVIKSGDAFWLPLDLLRKMGVEPKSGASAHGLVSTSQLGAESIHFDPATVSLDVTLPSTVFGQTTLAVGSATDSQPVLREAPVSLVLSYRLGARQSGQETQHLATTDLNLRVGPVLLRQENRLLSTNQQSTTVRTRTQAIFDQPDVARRWTLGDSTPTAGPFGSAASGAGLLVQKVWTMTPGALRQPRAMVRASTTLPADVELKVDGVPVYRGTVGPGPIEVDNLQYFGGRRNLQLTVTDVTGRRQVYDQPFLFADAALAAGVSDYSYFAGRRAELTTDGGWAYREPMWQGFHRYGVTDSVTAGVGGEGNADFSTVGAGLTLRSDLLGLVSLDALANRDRIVGGTAFGRALRYTYQTPTFGAVLGWRAFDPGFRSFISAPSLFPEREVFASVSKSLGPLSFGVEQFDSIAGTERRRSTTLRVFGSLGADATLTAELRAGTINGKRDDSLLVIYRKYLDRDHWVGATANAVNGGRTLSLETGRQVPAAEGFGYRAAVNTTTQGGHSMQDASLSGVLNLRAASLELAVNGPVSGGTVSKEIAVSGSVVAAGGTVALTRAVTDSFVVARLGVPEPGIDVLLNSQVQARTDARGIAVIPAVSSFDKQEVSVDDKQVPLKYQLGKRAQLIAPPYRSGLVVDLGARELHAVAGRAVRHDGSTAQPVRLRAWTMQSGARQIQLETSDTGEFYVENVVPGTYEGKLMADGKELACKLTIPAFDEPILELGEGVRCE